MKRILIINTVKFHTNGMSNVIVDLYRNMDRDGFLFDFVVNEKIETKYSEIIEQNGDCCYILHKRNSFPLLYIKQLTTIIKNHNYDIIHIHGNSALMSIELRAIQKSGSHAKVIVHVHNTNCTHPMLNKILYRYFIKHYDYAVACSDAAGKWLYKNRNFTVLNNGINEQQFRYNPELRDKYRKVYHIENQFVITHVGRFNKQKNHAFLIEIFKHIHKLDPSAVLRLVGTGELLNSVKQQVQDSGLSNYVSFVGKTDHPEIEYQVADVFVLPSLYESFGLVNVEAQCTGLPCIISDTVPGDIQIMKNVTFLPVSCSPLEWAKAILAFKNVHRESHHRDVIRHHYSINHEAQELRNYYLSVIDKK